MADNLRGYERFQVEDARETLATWDAEQGPVWRLVPGRETTLADQLRNVLTVVDSLAPKPEGESDG